MSITRIGQLLIVAILIIAAVGILIVLRPESGSAPQTMTLEEVINFSSFGVVESIEVRGDIAIVTFSQDYDTSQPPLSAPSRVFEMPVEGGVDIAARLRDAGVPVGADGVSVSQ